MVCWMDATLGGDLARRMEPYTTLRPQGSDNPRDLWKWLQAYEDRTGGHVLPGCRLPRNSLPA